MLNSTVSSRASQVKTLSAQSDICSLLSTLATPSYVIDESRLEKNLQILAYIQQKSQADILLALKAFSNSCTFDLVKKYLKGVTASSLHECQLASKKFKHSLHVYAPAYKASEFQEIQSLASHIVFNSVSQWQHFKAETDTSRVSCGLRINPEYSEVRQAMYNPCAKESRFGIKYDQLKSCDLSGISGFHFHALCQQNADVLERVWRHVEARFGPYLNKLKWINLGGGHFITKPGYKIDLLINLLNEIREKYQIKVILEPGEAVAYDAGYLSASVLDVSETDSPFVILDSSATAHMPDVLEMPYRPHIFNAALPGQKAYTYQLGGVTCLSGDVFGRYSFDQPLKVNDRIIFSDMAAYTMVKNTTFNGIGLPSIYLLKKNEHIKLIKRFGYKDFANRVS